MLRRAGARGRSAVTRASAPCIGREGDPIQSPCSVQQRRPALAASESAPGQDRRASGRSGSRRRLPARGWRWLAAPLLCNSRARRVAQPVAGNPPAAGPRASNGPAQAQRSPQVAQSRREPLDQTPGAGAGYLLALLAILFVAAFLRVYGLRSGLWLDEMISGWVVADGFSEIPARSWMANLSPLFFYVLRVCTGLLGFSEPALRLPSVLGGLALIVLVPAWLRSLGVGRGIGLACAALVAIDPALLAPSTWARPYALGIVASLVATIGFQRIALAGSQRTSDRALFVVGHTLGIYLHYVNIALLGWQLIVRGHALAQGSRPALHAALARDRHAVDRAALPALRAPSRAPRARPCDARIHPRRPARRRIEPLLRRRAAGRSPARLRVSRILPGAGALAAGGGVPASTCRCCACSCSCTRCRSSSSGG